MKKKVIGGIVGFVTLPFLFSLIAYVNSVPDLEHHIRSMYLAFLVPLLILVAVASVICVVDGSLG